MALDRTQRKQLRETLLAGFTGADALTLFLDDNLDLRLHNLVAPTQGFELQCLTLITELERRGQLIDFLEALAEVHPRPDTQQVATELRTALRAPARAAAA